MLNYRSCLSPRQSGASKGKGLALRRSLSTQSVLQSFCGAAPLQVWKQGAQGDLTVPCVGPGGPEGDFCRRTWKVKGRGQGRTPIALGSFQYRWGWVGNRFKELPVTSQQGQDSSADREHLQVHTVRATPHKPTPESSRGTEDWPNC